MAAVADATIAFVTGLDQWLKRAALESAGESVTRLRLLNDLHCNGPRKMADLAEALGVTPRAITAVVDTLEGDAQVRRVPHPSDRRVTLIELTGGRETVDRQFEALRAEVETLFAGLDPADRAAYARVVGVVLERLGGSGPG